MNGTFCASAGVNPRKCMQLRQMLRHLSRPMTRWNTIRTSSSPWSKTADIDELMASKSHLHVPELLCLRGALPAQCRAGEAHRGRPPGGHPPAGHEPPDAGADPGAARRRTAAAGHRQRIPEIQKVREGRTCRESAYLSASAARTSPRRWTSRRVAETLGHEPGVVFATDYPLYVLADRAGHDPRDASRNTRLTGVVICSCSPRMHEADLPQGLRQRRG